MKQKFRKLSFVSVSKDMPNHMSHFPSGFDGVIDGSYSQKYGGDNIASYSIYMITDNKIVNCISWYNEDQLTLSPNQDTEKAEEMIEAYNLK